MKLTLLVYNVFIKMYCANYYYIFMKYYDFLLGYSVTVGDFNEDGEDGKMFFLDRSTA